MITLNCRWLRFSLRTLLVAVAAFCIWLGGEVDHVQQRKQMRARLEPHARFVAVTAARQNKWFLPYDHVSEIPFWRRWMGDESIGWIWLPEDQQRQEHDRAAALFPEAIINEPFERN